MNYEQLLFNENTSQAPTRACLIGVGEFGRTCLMQSRRIPHLSLDVLCDLDIDHVINVCKSAGLSNGDVEIADRQDAVERIIKAGKVVITQDPQIAIKAPVDVVVEATGNAEAGADNCAMAIASGRHIVLVTKETDCVIGPLLAQRARRAGLVLSQVDGDQPSLLLALVSWARSLGMEIACAGKASEYDFVFDVNSGVIAAAGLGQVESVDRSLWHTQASDLPALIQRRASALAAIPQRTPPDYCEMCIVANGAGLKPDRAELHAPVARQAELADILRPVSHGGVLSGVNRLDTFNCLRRPDELSAAGGVFAVLAVPDEETGLLFRGKGIPMSRDNRHVLVFNPTHLLGVEAPMSMLVAHRLGQATGSSIVRPVCDVVMRATEALDAGTSLTEVGNRHRIDGVEALLVDYTRLAPSAPVPYFLAAGHPLRKPVAKGEVISVDAVDVPKDSTLWSLRREQDESIEPS